MFRLSAAGERYFREQLEHIILDLQSPDPTLEIAFVLLGQLPRHEAVRLLRERAQRIVEQEKRLSRIIGDISQRSAAGFLGLSHTIARLHSERQSLRDSRALVEDAKWHPEWVLDDGPIVDPSRSL